MSTFKYIPSFDGIRAAAVVLVVLLHGSYGFFKGGWIGVDLFFILSGYLITSLLQNEYFSTGTISFKNFYIRRALRLFPPLIICLVLGNALWPYFNKFPNANQYVATLAGLFYFSNMINEKVLGTLSQLWSLSVEEHFYFLWPIILYKYFVKAPARKQLIAISIAVGVIALFRIYIGNFHQPITYGLLEINSYTFTLCRFDSILMGAGLAIYLKHFNFKTDTKYNNSYILYGLTFTYFAISIFVSASSKFMLNGGFMLTNILCFCTVLFAIKFPNQVILSSSIPKWIGKRSYGLYLYHLPIFLALESLRIEHSVANLLVVTILRLVLTVIITELSFRFVEKSILKFKKSFQAGKSKPTTVALEPMPLN